MSSSNAGQKDSLDTESDQEMQLIDAMLPTRYYCVNYSRVDANERHLRPPSAFFETMKQVGLFDLPWILPLEHLEKSDLVSSRKSARRRRIDVSFLYQADRVLKVIADTSTELSVWAKNPFQPENTNAPLAVGLIATYVLLAGSGLDLASIGRNPCTPSPQVAGCIQIGGSSIDTFVKLYDWTAVVEKALTSMEKYNKGALPTPSEPLGEDQVANLYTLFHIAKQNASESKITANMVLAALAVRYVIEVGTCLIRNLKTFLTCISQGKGGPQGVDKRVAQG